MNSDFITQAVAIVKDAVDFDNAGDYEKAYPLYKRALEYFLTGIKYEKNPSARAAISARVSGYMKRAEDLKAVLQDQSSSATNSGGAPKGDMHYLITSNTSSHTLISRGRCNQGERG
jgi:vacuolar protein-sorting-associated protein 4